MASGTQAQPGQPPGARLSHDAWLAGALLIALMVVGTAVHAIGLRQELPYTPQVDEPLFVIPALKIVASGDLNPHWFGHPGSTVIYPIALATHLDNVRNGSPLFQVDPAFWDSVLQDPSPYFMLGRWLALLYWIGCVPLIALLGQRFGGWVVGLLATLLVTLSPMLLEYVQIVRTDIAGTFFALLTLLAAVRLTRHRRQRDLALVGIALGLSIATRYFLVMLIPPLVLYCLRLARQHGHARPWRVAADALLVIGSVAVLTFAVSSPFTLLDYRGTISSLRAEARNTALGADGLSPLGNLWWYVREGLAGDLGWPFVALALGGTAIALRRRQALDVLLLSYVVCFLFGISLSSLHWDRWLIPVLPVLAVFAAHALTVVWRRAPRPLARIALLAALTAIVVPALDAVHTIKQQQTGTTTRVLARRWVDQTLPLGSRIAQEKYTVPLNPADFFGLVTRTAERPEQPLTARGFLVHERFSLATDRTIADYQRVGVRYLIVSSAIYERYLSEPDRYPDEVRFYQTLFHQGQLVQQFEPGARTIGPIILIYELPATPE